MLEPEINEIFGDAPLVPKQLHAMARVRITWIPACAGIVASKKAAPGRPLFAAAQTRWQIPH